MQAEIERVLKLSSEEQRALIIYKDIVENILNLRCPRCKSVFIDFDGCMALTCTYRNCGAGICGYCLVDCGYDAHAHVNQCGGLNASFVMFEEHQRKRRTHKLNEKLASLFEPTAVMDILKRRLAQDLIDLGINITL
jgi:hypothetical protein